MVGAGTVGADRTDRTERLFTSADDLSVTAQELVGALAGWHCRGQLAGRNLSPAVAGRIGACGVAEAQPGKNPQAVSIQSKDGPDPGEQVNAVGPRRPDAWVSTPRCPRNGKLRAPAQALGSFRWPGTGHYTAQRILRGGENLLRF